MNAENFLKEIGALIKVSDRHVLMIKGVCYKN